MKRLVFTDGYTRYTRISKVEARKTFNSGKTIYVIPHKIRPGYSFSMGMYIDGTHHLNEFQNRYPNGHPDIPNFNAFDQMLDNFCFYNANCHETGTYAAFYLTEDLKTRKECA